MKVDSVLERIKIWVERGIAQEITLHISPEGDCNVHRKTIIKDEDSLNFESIEVGAVAID